ncbi:MAG: hypothetical protein KR126chlam5_00605 [Candidatus Anoxychlamydiales bacterium]|nr:hypothetical protein [Candidatus Anoxychlamydiales bacterium]
MIKFEYPEGATPIDDISGLKLSWVKTQGHLNRVEAENISYAIEKYLLKTVSLPINWFNISSLKKIHKDMFFNVWDWAGCFRTFQTIPGISPYQIQSALKDLCDDVLYWNTEGCEMTFIEQATKIHHRLVYIHPFPNGNGRFSRIVADRYLKAMKCIFPIWPQEIQRNSNDRKEYIFSLKKADIGDYSLLMDFIKKFGAREPLLNELLVDKFFRNLKRPFLRKILIAYLKQGHNVNETSSGHFPLQLAIKNGLEDISKILINANADILNKDKSGFTSFEMAIWKKQYNIAKCIYDYGYPYKPRHPPVAKLLNYYSHLDEFDKQYF